MTKPIALIEAEIPQQAMAKARREELQRKAGSRLLKSYKSVIVILFFDFPK